MSTIITKNSSTASAVPVAGDLVKGELAVNVTDKKVYTKDNSSAVVKLVGSLGNQEASAVAITGGTIAGITDLAVADGGTGASTAADARTNLGVTATGADTTYAFRANNLSDLASAFTARTNLGLGTIATQASSNVTITGGSVTGITDLAVADGGTGASTAANARTNLGAAASGANSDITSLSGLTTALSVAQGGTGVTSSTGTGSVVLSNSPTLVTPALGTPSSVTLTNATGLPVSTGISGLATNVATFLGSPTSANLRATVTDETGSGSLVFATSPYLVTPDLGVPSAATLTNATGLPVATGISGLGTGVATALAVNVGTAGAPVVNGGALGTPSSGTVTNLTGTASININGTVGATTATTGAFTDLTTSGSVTHNGGTANGVAYLNASKVLTSGSALTFDGTNLYVGGTTSAFGGTQKGFAAESGAVIAVLNGESANSVGSVGTVSNHDFSFKTNGSEQMRLTSTGLGIGTSSPTLKLDVNGSAKFAGSYVSFNDNGYIRTDAANILRFQPGSGGYQFRNVSNSDNLAVLDSSGNLGLGVTPSAWFASSKALQIGTPLALEAISNASVLFNNTYRNTAGSLRYSTSAASGFYAIDGNVHTWNTAPSGTAGDAISFTQAMTLDASGNLGIGTSSPATKLHISGSTTPNLRFEQTNSSVVHQFQAASGNFYLNIDATNVIGGSTFLIQQAGSTAVTLSSTGNLGLGVTPSAWGATFTSKALQVGATSALYTNTFANSVHLSNNQYDAGGGVQRYITTGNATDYRQVSGTHAWLIAPSGTAGNAISFTQAMTLDASARLTIGYTSAGNAEKLGASGTVISTNQSINTFAYDQAGFDYNTSTKEGRFFSTASGGAGFMSFFTGSGTERARITSGGDLLVGTTSARGVGTTIYDSSSGVGRIDINKSASGAATAMGFYFNGTIVGSISYSDTATAYNTSSDYRLKNITGPITTSGAYIDSLNPVEGTWKTDGSTFVGLIAHEVQEASRTPVATGVKDGEEMQGMDYSSAEIIANLIAEVKSLRQRLAAAGI